MLASVMDGFVNAATILAGAGSVFIRPTRRWLRKRCNGYNGHCWGSQKVITDFLNGATAVPFACMAATVFYPGLAPIILANKATLAMAGAIGLIFVIGEIITAGRDD